MTHGRQCECHDCVAARMLARDALKRIERARAELHEAWSSLSPLDGAIAEWEEAGRLAGGTKQLWHQVNAKYSDWVLDGMHRSQP